MGKKIIERSNNVHKDYLPPESGWGYVIALAMPMMMIVTVGPFGALGIYLGTYLASFGDEASKLSFVNSVFFAVHCFTGLVAAQFLKKWSFRKVCLIGSTFFVIGSIALAFATTYAEIILTFGVLQGFGFGLAISSTMGIFNAYFEKRRNVVMCLAQTLGQAFGIISPIIINYSMNNYGFMGTQALIGAFSLNLFAVALSFQPVKWHALKKKNELHQINSDDVEIQEIKMLANEEKFNIDLKSGKELDETDINSEDKSFWSSLLESFDFSLFRDPSFINLSVGLAMTFYTDITFLTLTPTILRSSGYDGDTVAYLISISQTSAVISTMLLTVVSALCKISNVKLVLGAMVLSFIARTAFIISDLYIWKLILLVVIGAIRCCIQVPIPLAISERYKDTFTTAFSLNMVVIGVISLIVSALVGLVQQITNDVTMIIHVLNLLNIVLMTTWILEMYLKKANSTNK